MAYSGDPHTNFPRLTWKIIGLRHIKGIDGIDFMLNKPHATLNFLETGDTLEALWLDVDPAASKVSNSW